MAELTEDDITGTGDATDGKTEKPPRSEKAVDRENERLKAKNYEKDQAIIKLQKQLEEALEEKKKPGIKEIDENGVEKKKRREFTNRWGLSQFVIPPYTKRRIAIYQAIDGDGGINPATGFPVEPFDILVPGNYTFTDKFEKDPFKQKKQIENIVGAGTKMQDGIKILTDEVADILFPRGWKHVDVENDFTLYVFLELHPNNASNRYRPSNYPKIFKRVDIDTRSKSALSATVDLQRSAMNIVAEMKKDEIYDYGAAVPEIQAHAGRPLHEIRTDLMRWAMANPVPFFKLNKNAKAGIQITILDALAFGLIEYDVNKKSYIFIETDEEISTHTAAEEPMERLLKELATTETGKEWYGVIQERLNYWQQ